MVDLFVYRRFGGLRNDTRISCAGASVCVCVCVCEREREIGKGHENVCKLKGRTHYGYAAVHYTLHHSYLPDCRQQSFGSYLDKSLCTYKRHTHLSSKQKQLAQW